MKRAILIAVAFCLCITSSTRAGDVAPVPEIKDDPAWKPFHELIAGAKSSMMGNPEEALAIARKAEDFAADHASAPRQSEALATSLWLEAEALTRINQIDKARSTIDRAIELAARDGKFTKLDGDISLTLARTAETSGDLELALKSFHKAHDIFASLGEARSQSMALQGLGAIYDQAHDFEHEIEYYRRATQVYSGDPTLELSAANNLGFALKQLGRYDEALEDFDRALTISVALKSPFLQARVLTNIASVRVKRHEFAEAEKAADKALKLLGKNDESGWAPFIWGVKAEIEYARGGLDAAERDLKKAFQGTDLKTTIAPYRDIHEIAYKVYRAKDDFAMGLAHHEAFKRLDDEGRSLSASANLALMGAQFDFTAQQLEIEQLQTEKLKRDISLAKSRATTQTTILISISLISIIVIVWFGWGYFSIRRHRNAINRANIELQKTVAERETEIARRKETEWQLRESKEIAEQANRAKTQFLANMSHELRTPLNAIIGFSEIMSKELLGLIGTPTYKGYASNIYVSGRHLLAILNDILDMARIDAGKVALAEEDLNLSEAVESGLRVFQQEVLSPGKTIHFSTEEADLLVRADERMLRQILINLVSNSVKFTGEPGVINVRIECATDGGVDLLVSDNGIGIPENKLDLIMEPFGQVDDAFARSHGGVGLGLPIVKSLIELHGGTFSLWSKLNEGTTARVHLPAARVLNAPRPAERRALAS
jgi:signal transduction histidine kinase/tetratricopeptide (TPR) repeat protein